MSENWQPAGFESGEILMRRGRSKSDATAMQTAAVSVQNTGATRGEGETVRGKPGTTVTMNGPIGTARTATVTDNLSGRVIGTVKVDRNCVIKND